MAISITIMSLQGTTENVASSIKQERYEVVKRQGKEKTQATSQKEGYRPMRILQVSNIYHIFTSNVELNLSVSWIHH